MKEDYQEMINSLPDESFKTTCQNLDRNVQYIEQVVTGMNATSNYDKRILILRTCTAV